MKYFNQILEMTSFLVPKRRLLKHKHVKIPILAQINTHLPEVEPTDTLPTTTADTVIIQQRKESIVLNMAKHIMSRKAAQPVVTSDKKKRKQKVSPENLFRLKVHRLKIHPVGPSRLKEETEFSTDDDLDR